MNKRKTHFYSLRRDETALSPSQQLRSAEDCESHGPETWEEGAGRRLRLGQNRVSSSPPHPLVPTCGAPNGRWQQNTTGRGTGEEQNVQGNQLWGTGQRKDLNLERTRLPPVIHPPPQTRRVLAGTRGLWRLWWWPQQQHLSHPVHLLTRKALPPPGKAPRRSTLLARQKPSILVSTVYVRWLAFKENCKTLQKARKNTWERKSHQNQSDMIDVRTSREFKITDEYVNSSNEKGENIQCQVRVSAARGKLWKKKKEMKCYQWKTQYRWKLKKKQKPRILCSLKIIFSDEREIQTVLENKDWEDPFPADQLDGKC